MNSYRVVVAEFATGIVRRIDDPKVRFQIGGTGADRTFFETEEEALRFRDEILEAHHDLEVVIGIEDHKETFRRFFYRDGSVVSD